MGERASERERERERERASERERERLEEKSHKRPEKLFLFKLFITLNYKSKLDHLFLSLPLCYEKSALNYGKFFALKLGYFKSIKKL